MEKRSQTLFNQRSLRLIDDSWRTEIFGQAYQAITSFALEDAIATAVGKEKAPMSLRFWVHDRTLVLGIPDARLPYLQDGVEYVRSLGYHVLVRNSGGLAVLLDKQVLNVSLLVPSSHSLSIDEGYDTMFQLVKEILEKEGVTIQAYEIIGSYCPGDYDLSIDGKKFAGLSQRRVREGFSIQMYLDVAGNSYERAEIVRTFYNLAKKGQPTRFTYPEVNPSVMASLSQLLERKVTVEEMKEAFLQALTRKGAQIQKGDYTEYERELFTQRMEQMEKRNEILRF